MTKVLDWFQEYQDDPEYLFELASLAIAEEIVARMESLGLNRRQLAKRLGVSAPRVTQLLAGDDNLTLKTLTAVAAALDATVSVTFAPRTSARKVVPSDWTAWITGPRRPAVARQNRDLAQAA
ncbi:MAG TPA: helix-turn-helix transcriptional regulator [Tepidiformaceae bacterium]|nr:helix-turn-helix transcriptional regulator [Tepidiformaceae bacterium]